ncbi:MAG TPA: DUF262 domain-containing HNH endonuclease family protein [Propioniciclava tarda]|nr:DUF262 domain-containing HNH endonuclease family protein [Propioniciclava tarda]
MPDHQEVNLGTAINNRLLFVPDYQRPYAWQEKQLTELWEDIDLLGPNGRHYTGTLVFKSREDETFRTIFGTTLVATDVVDGQQRLTTALLLVDRIRRAFEGLAQRGIEDAPVTAQSLKDLYGCLKLGGVVRARLSLGEDLNPYWTDSILGDLQSPVGTPTAGHERLKSAATFFDDKITALIDGTDDHEAETRLRDLLGRVTDGLKFLVYEVGSSAEVGVIFETLNGRGKPLSELERIKNYLLFIIRTLPDQRRDAMADLINHSWSGIFNDLAGVPVDEDQLLRAHWLATQNSDARTWKGVDSIKSIFARSTYVRMSQRLGGPSPEGNDSDEQLADRLTEGVEEYVRTLRICAMYVREMQQPNATFAAFTSHHDEARSALGALRRSRNMATFRPLLLAARLTHPSDGEFFAQLVRLCETYAARVFTIAQRRANAGQTSLYRLGKRLADGQIDRSEALDELAALAWFFASDDRVRASFTIDENWYFRRGHKYFLYEYELDITRNRSTVPPFEFFVGDTYGQTTEHVLPQTPDWESDDWRHSFTREEHARLQHGLGNLALTWDNSSYSNKSYAGKRGSVDQTASPCYFTSSLAQEREIAQQYDDWNADAITSRLATLRDFALRRWPLAAPPADPATELESGEGDPDGSDDELDEAADTDAQES